jgi:hypothetical protein
MRIRIAIPDDRITPELLEPVLETVTRVNESMIRDGTIPTASELVARGAIWRPENLGDEHFDHGATIQERGWGDCDDWAPLKAAEMRATGEDPGAHATIVPSGPTTYHAIVQRSSGEQMRGADDISVQAGMRGHAAISGDGNMQVWACDPHDGRIYQGALAPTVGPLTIHCGPGLAIRGCCVVGGGRLYEARVDMPISGSPLVRVVGYSRTRHGPKRRVRVHGHVPYALSVTHVARSPLDALDGALCGAVLCGDAAELNTSVDRYKLLALQSAMAGMSAGQVHDALQAAIHTDMMAASAASGLPPESHVADLLSQTPHAHAVVGGLFSDIGHIASSIVSDVSKVASAVGKAANIVPWGDILHGVQAAVSVVPGLGTAVSEIVATAETAYESAAALLTGNPFEAALHAAYNFALGAVPGADALRIVLDPVVNTLIGMTGKKEPVEDAALDGLLANVPDVPRFGNLSPRSVASSLAHLIVAHLGVKKTKGHIPKSQPSTATGVVKAMPTPAPKVVPLPLHPASPPSRGVAHAAMPASPLVAPHPTAAQAPSLSPSAASIKTTWHCAPLPGGHWACAWQ